MSGRGRETSRVLDSLWYCDNIMLGKHRYTEHANKFHKRLRLDIDSIGSDLLVSAREREWMCGNETLLFSSSSSSSSSSSWLLLLSLSLTLLVAWYVLWSHYSLLVNAVSILFLFIVVISLRSFTRSWALTSNVSDSSNLLFSFYFIETYSMCVPVRYNPSHGQIQLSSDKFHVCCRNVKLK